MSHHGRINKCIHIASTCVHNFMHTYLRILTHNVRACQDVLLNVSMMRCMVLLEMVMSMLLILRKVIIGLIWWAYFNVIYLFLHISVNSLCSFVRLTHDIHRTEKFIFIDIKYLGNCS